jgi:mitofusin
VPYSAELSGFGVVSALGAFSMVGSKAMGLRSAFDAFSRFTEIASTPAARKIIGPIIGVAAIAGVAYIITELPRSIPRNVGRHLQATLLVSSGINMDAELMPFSEAVSVRVGKEVRKVMRIAQGDVKDKYNKGLEVRQDAVKEREDAERRAEKALEFFEGTKTRVEEIRGMVGGVKI